MLLSAHDLLLRRGERTLARGLDLTLHSGEGVHVSGPNGAGKTTLLRTLAGLVWPAAGQVCWNGTPIVRQREAFAAALVWLGHADALAADLTAREQLRLALAGRTRADAADLGRALERAGLAAAADRPARMLSAGQRRRVGLARLALSTAAPLWLLDEPLTALDADGCTLVTRLVTEHLERGGMVVLSTHQALPGLEDLVAHLELAAA